ncbi:MAG: beta-ketoacyl-[acyl-carrier-protein] synthase family protein [Shinella zoogloeoides]|uniref:beta-ketoacyl-[acyl-carrier-protein] synthase family protein n=1 Tax=Shinella zoogloeoides TaxID=352475 RepID=UPI003C70A17B
MKSFRAPDVVVTGSGVLSSLGLSTGPFLEAVFSGQSSIDSLSANDWGLRFSNAAVIRDFDPLAHFSERDLSQIDRFAQFGTVAAREAWAASGLAMATLDKSRVAVIVGSANGGIDVLEDGFRRVLVGGLTPQPMTVPKGMGNAPACRIAFEIGARGPVFGVTSACASAAHAILLGASLIRGGLVDVAVVGGTDSTHNEGSLRAWNALRAVSADTCRPFSTGRQGLILGEGAGVLVLESAAHAARRGADVLGRYLGGGMGCDAGHLLAPDSTGMADTMRAALTDSQLAAEDIDYINAHGTGTVANDRAEAQAINSIFGNRVPTSSTKSMIGHALGASGALEAIVTIAALDRGLLPPTLNYLGADPEIDLDPVPHHARAADTRYALSNSFAFGGLNVVLAFGRPDA